MKLFGRVFWIYSTGFICNFIFYKDRLMIELDIGLLSFAVICLIVISFLDYRWSKRLEERIAELEYKNKHRVFTGGKPTNKLS